uniref:C2H2-type domain-containing protein n=1 Tax=Mycena chlorophos TaxID=658473 RepID=A0ABQ0MAZ0_MYCCL|nr:predicted protein [Mycena chlorophos]
MSFYEEFMFAASGATTDHTTFLTSYAAAASDDDEDPFILPRPDPCTFQLRDASPESFLPFRFAFQDADPLRSGEQTEADVFEELRRAAGVSLRDVDIFDDGRGSVEPEGLPVRCRQLTYTQSMVKREFGFATVEEEEERDVDMDLVHVTEECAPMPSTPRRRPSFVPLEPSERRTPPGSRVGGLLLAPPPAPRKVTCKKSISPGKKAASGIKIEKRNKAAKRAVVEAVVAAVPGARNALASKTVNANASTSKRAGVKGKGTFKCAAVPHKAVAANRASGKYGVLPELWEETLHPCFHYLHYIGCSLLNDGSGGMECHCGKTTGNVADMTRHIYCHHRKELELPCAGCPLAFARPDSLERHVKICERYPSAARKRLVQQFKALPQIARILDQDEVDARDLKARWEAYLKA